MTTRRLVIRAHGGAHARPVAELVRIALAHTGTVTLTTADGRVADLRSVLAVMDLNLPFGEEVVLEAHGAGSEQVLDLLQQVLDPHAT